MDTRIIPSAPAIPARNSAPLASVEIGKTLNAAVVNAKTQQVTLRIGDQLMEARLTADQTSIKQRFQREGAFPASFKVIQTEPQLVLQLVKNSASPKINPAAEFARQSLPYQRSLVELVKSLANGGDFSGAKNNSNHASAHFRELNRLTRDIVQRVATVSTLSTASGLATAITSSGVLYESRLVRWMKQKSGVPSNDLKWQLLSASSLIDKMLKAGAQTEGLRSNIRQLGTQIEAGLARIETLQLASYQASSEENVRLFFELPLTHHENVRRIHGYLEQTRNLRKDGGGVETSITLEIEVSARRSILARLTHSSPGLKIDLWSDDPALQQGILSRAAILEQNLNSKQPSKAAVKLQRVDTNGLDPLRTFNTLLADEA